MPTSYSQAARLCSFILLISAAGARGDYSTPEIKPDSYQSRLAQRRQQLRKEQEELIARQDRLYNEITTDQARPTVWQQYGWTVLTAVVLIAVFIRLAIDRRWRRFLRRRAERARYLRADDPPYGW